MMETPHIIISINTTIVILFLHSISFRIRHRIKNTFRRQFSFFLRIVVSSSSTSISKKNHFPRREEINFRRGHNNVLERQRTLTPTRRRRERRHLDLELNVRQLLEGIGRAALAASEHVGALVIHRAFRRVVETVRHVRAPFVGRVERRQLLVQVEIDVGREAVHPLGRMRRAAEFLGFGEHDRAGERAEEVCINRRGLVGEEALAAAFQARAVNDVAAAEVASGFVAGVGVGRRVEIRAVVEQRRVVAGAFFVVRFGDADLRD